MFKNSHLRLLMTVAGLQRLGPAAEETRDSTWVIPEDVSASHLKDTVHFINQAEFSPPTFDEGVLAEHQLKRKTVRRKKAAFDDDEDDDDGDLGMIDDSELFPAGGPTARKAIDDPSRPKKTKRRRKRKETEGEEDDDDDSAAADRARMRRERELEKQRRIKSALIVREGDDEFDSDEDEEFFARERALKARAEEVAKTAAADPFKPLPAAAAAKKRKPAAAALDDSDEDKSSGADSEEEDDDDDLSIARKVLSSQNIDVSDAETEDVPRRNTSSDGDARKKRRLSDDDEEDEDEDEDVNMTGTDAAPPAPKDAEDEDAPVLARRPRVRGGFIVDSDDDE